MFYHLTSGQVYLSNNLKDQSGLENSQFFWVLSQNPVTEEELTPSLQPHIVMAHLRVSLPWGALYTSVDTPACTPKPYAYSLLQTATSGPSRMPRGEHKGRGIYPPVMHPRNRTKQGLGSDWGPFGQKSQFLGTLNMWVPVMEGCSLCPTNSLPLWEGHGQNEAEWSPLKHRGPLAQDQALPWHGWTRPWMPPRTPHCLQTFLTPTAYAPSEAPATLSSCHRWCFLWEHIWQENLLCAEFWVVLGLALTLGANTDIHTEQSGLCRSSMGFGLWQRNRPLLSPLLEPEPSQCQGGKTKAFRSRLGGKPTFPSPFFPRDNLVLACHGWEDLSASLPKSEYLWGSRGGPCVHLSILEITLKSYAILCISIPLPFLYLVCLSLSLGLSASVCVCAFGVRGPAFIRLSEISMIPKGFWAPGLRG